MNPRGAFLCSGQIWFVKRLEIKATVTFVGRACGGAERMPRRNNNDKERGLAHRGGAGAGQVFGPSHKSQAIATALPARPVVSLLGVLFINFSPTLPSSPCSPLAADGYRVRVQLCYTVVYRNWPTGCHAVYACSRTAFSIRVFCVR